MGGEGGMMHAIKSLKNNRELLKKRKLRSKNDVYGTTTVTKLHFKESTPEIMEKIKMDMDKERRFHQKMLFISTLLILGFITILIWWLS